jgi:hypothetical protein
MDDGLAHLVTTVGAGKIHDDLQRKKLRFRAKCPAGRIRQRPPLNADNVGSLGG